MHVVDDLGLAHRTLRESSLAIKSEIFILLLFVHLVLQVPLLIGQAPASIVDARLEVKAGIRLRNLLFRSKLTLQMDLLSVIQEPLRCRIGACASGVQHRLRPDIVEARG